MEMWDGEREERVVLTASYLTFRMWAERVRMLIVKCVIIKVGLPLFYMTYDERSTNSSIELLVNFFKAAIPSLAPHGSIIVTLFDGMPYSLWNIRDLARHSGLAVERSFKFQAIAYPGYKHARTIGVVKNKDGEEAGSAWKGEDRPSRSFVLMRREDLQTKAGQKKEVVDGKPSKSKMRGERDSEGSSDEDEDMGTWTVDEEDLPENAGVYDGNNESENEPI